MKMKSIPIKKGLFCLEDFKKVLPKNALLYIYEGLILLMKDNQQQKTKQKLKQNKQKVLLLCSKCKSKMVRYSTPFGFEYECINCGRRID